MDEEAPKEIEEKIKDRFVGHDFRESYIYYRNYIPDNPIEEFYVKKKCIEIGKELLPEGEKKLYADACKLLSEVKVAKRKTEYTYKDDGRSDGLNYVYTISSADADNTDALREDYKEILKNFIHQQYEQKVVELQEMDDKIFHALTSGKKPIIKVIDPTIDILVEDLLKADFGGGSDVSVN